jgi:hypothetical protein
MDHALSHCLAAISGEKSLQSETAIRKKEK